MLLLLELSRYERQVFPKRRRPTTNLRHVIFQKGEGSNQTRFVVRNNGTEHSHVIISRMDDNSIETYKTATSSHHQFKVNVCGNYTDLINSSSTYTTNAIRPYNLILSVSPFIMSACIMTRCCMQMNSKLNMMPTEKTD
jgi:hypothetical protein